MKSVFAVAWVLWAAHAFAGGDKPNATGVSRAKPPGKGAPAKGPKPTEPMAEPNDAQNALAARFRAAASTDAQAASAAARAYLSGQGRDPATARDMLAWLSAEASLAASGELAKVGADPEAQLRASLGAIKSALPRVVEVHTTQYTMVPGDIVPVFTQYETDRWTYAPGSSPAHCHFTLGGKVNHQVIYPHGEEDHPDTTDDPLDIQLDWNLAALEPSSVRVQAGTVIEQENAQRDPLHHVSAGVKVVRAITPEYYTVTVNQSGSGYLNTDAMVFTDESTARNVAVQLMHALALCHRPPAASAVPRGGPPVTTRTISDEPAVERAPRAVTGDHWESQTRIAAGKDRPASVTTTKRRVTEVSVDKVVVADEAKIGNEVSVTTTTLTPDWSVVSTAVPGTNPWTMTYDVPLANYRFPMRPGMAWHQRTSLTSSGEFGSTTGSERDVTVLGWESVTVPAGTFKCLKLKIVERPDEPGDGPKEYTYTSWYSPEAKTDVKTESAEAVTELVSFEVK